MSYPPTSAKIAPSFTAGPADGSPGSSSTTPTNAGQKVTFSATASDSDNSDNYYLAICKHGVGITPASNAPPVCGGGSSDKWCISTSTVHDVPASCTYQTSASSSESNAWDAYVCDYNSASACSTISQGSGDSGSPFSVNRNPSFSAATATSPVSVGNPVTFGSTSSDPDSDGTPDTVTLYACKSNDFTGTACGTRGQWCASAATASNAFCNYTIQSGDGVGTKNFFSYIIDNHSLGALINFISGTFTISGTGGASTLQFSGKIKIGGNTSAK